MSVPDVQTRILGSASFQSLSSEQTILSVLKDLGWGAIHSCFYVDGKTEKLREIDVLGRRIWERTLKNRQDSADLYLIAEAKSAKGFHLLFSPLEGSAAFKQANTQWFGWDEEQTIIFRMLPDIGLTAEQTEYVRKALQKIAFPKGGLRYGRLSVDPPPAEVYASAFRETNIGGEKDLESSVLWRASLSLASAVSSLKQQSLNHLRESLTEEFELAPLVKLDPIGQVIEQLEVHLSTLSLFHPIVVIDAPLWLVKRGELSDIKWCRFQQLDTYGRSEWWFDAVHSEHFQQYAKELTQYYEERYKRARAKPYKFAKGFFTTYPHEIEINKSVKAEVDKLKKKRQVENKHQK